jgi:hypothetical protein
MALRGRAFFFALNCDSDASKSQLIVQEVLVGPTSNCFNPDSQPFTLIPFATSWCT